MDTETLLTETFRSIVNGWGIVTSLRQFGELGMPAALSAMELQSAMAAEYMVQQGLIVPIDPNAQVPTDYTKTKQILSTALTTQSRANVVWAIDAASLIFMHSVLDDALDSFCRISAMHCPNDWESEVDQKVFELKHIKNKSYSDLLQEALKKPLRDLRKDSVLNKCEVLHRICKPPAQFTPIKGHKYDSNDLEAIDKKRHAVVHSSNLGHELKDIEKRPIVLERYSKLFFDFDQSQIWN